MSSGCHKKVGTFIGTGAAKVIALDFTPRYVRLLNLTDLASAEKYADSDVATKEGGVKRITAGDMSALTAAQGIVLGDHEFTVGTDAVCNGSGDHISYFAEA
jgi:hypothetical protein